MKAMTKEQFERCERMEAAGGPKANPRPCSIISTSSKNNNWEMQDSSKEQFQSDILEKLLEVQQLERSIEKLQGQLQNERITLENMTGTLMLLGDEM